MFQNQTFDFRMKPKNSRFSPIFKMDNIHLKKTFKEYLTNFELFTDKYY